MERKVSKLTGYETHSHYTKTMTAFTGRTIPTTTFTGRPIIARTNTIAPIITGIWSDLATWTETGKYWNDSGDGAGTIFTGRTIPA